MESFSICSNDLGKDITLLLMVDLADYDTLHNPPTPICWKVLKFEPTGKVHHTVQFSNIGVLIIPKKSDKNLISSVNAQRIKTGQTCVMTTSESGGNVLSAPSVGANADIISCKFDVSEEADVAFGLYKGDGEDVDPIMIWNNISSGH
uniref:Uncharacterized protein n=1 Tax=Psilocybe cubensis TaxID=181762 RepID=A0A8H7XQ69_PSICU